MHDNNYAIAVRWQQQLCKILNNSISTDLMMNNMNNKTLLVDWQVTKDMITFCSLKQTPTGQEDTNFL